MSDEVDMAQACQETLTGFAIDRVRQQLPASRVSASVCEVCGGPVPAARQRALPGVTVCVDCQQAREQRQPLYPGCTFY